MADEKIHYSELVEITNEGDSSAQSICVSMLRAQAAASTLERKLWDMGGCPSRLT
jgi:hypothetical protein